MNESRQSGDVIDIAPARLEREIQASERQAFEDALLEEVYRRGKGIISAYIGDARSSFFRAVINNVTCRLEADAEFLGRMRELQQLPVGEDARERRLAAFASGIQQYIMQAIREELPKFETISITEALRGD